MAITLSRRGLLNAPVAVFRVDAGPGLGMTHFMRCRALAIELLRRSWIVHFVGHGLPEEMLFYRGKNLAINYIPFPSYRESEQDVRAFIRLLRESFFRNLACIIVDSYRFNRDDYVRLQFYDDRVPVAVINDVAEHDTPAQVVINPNPLFSPEPYERQRIPSILCGEAYTLIRPEITALRDRKYNPDGPLLINMGGVNQATLTVLQSLPDLCERKVIVFVDQDSLSEEIQAWENECPQMRRIETSVSRLPELLFESAITISGGGEILWEIYCLGIPNICIVWAENSNNSTLIIKDQATGFLIDVLSNINVELQSDMLESGLNKIVETLGPPGQTRFVHEIGFRTAEIINKHETSIAIDGLESIDKRTLRKALSRLTSACGFPQEMMERQRELIDGLGAQRIAEVLEQQKWQEVSLFASDYSRYPDSF
jgi:spore coat polysaccharide biosynthesis predicted glycosyltransferase SpsG